MFGRHGQPDGKLIGMADTCSECGAPIDTRNDSADLRQPCPVCGSTKRTFRVRVEDGAVFRDHLSLEQRRQGDAIGYSESERDGLSSQGAVDAAGELSFGLEGVSPQGEDDTLSVCARLVECLKQDGADWTSLSSGSGDEDCVAVSSADQSVHLRIQVVRAVVRSELWRKLSAQGKVERTGVPVRELVEDLHQAIEHKSGKRGIPPIQRKAIVLAIDATRLPAHSLSGSVRAFRDAYGQWASTLGYPSIWLVGPSATLTSRLDCREDHAE
jgi:DNA-directed RNA polymerase subunit RPC12/RpoP